MDYEIYKKLNEELINTVQQLKTDNSTLERELIQATAKYFDERQTWLEERRLIELKYIQIIKNLKKEFIISVNGAISEINCDEILTETPPSLRNRTTLVMRRSSMGVTTRSPLKSINSEVITNDSLRPHPAAIVEETDKNENDKNTSARGRNMWGLSDLRENTENDPENSSSCQSVDTTIHSPEEVRVENRTKTMPTLRVNDRRATQLWRKSPNGLDKASSANKCDNSNRETNNINYDHLRVASIQNSRTIESLSADFSENLVLHSTPRSSENMDSTPNNASSTLQNQSDKSHENCSLRPRRHCAAVSYVEPPINKKMRDDSKKLKPKKKKSRAK